MSLADCVAVHSMMTSECRRRQSDSQCVVVRHGFLAMKMAAAMDNADTVNITPIVFHPMLSEM